MYLKWYFYNYGSTDAFLLFCARLERGTGLELGEEEGLKISVGACDGYRDGKLTKMVGEKGL